MKEQEVTLTEAELSDVKNSIATLCKKYIAGSFFDKLVDSSGIKIAKDILMSDLKEMIGHGTSAPAAKKFATAILTAKSTPAVDTILANYMLKGDGMGAGIGYNESTAVPVKSFQQFLSEARKAEKIDGKPSQEMIDEAIKTVEAEGYKVNKIAEKSASHEVITQDQIDEAIEVAKKHGYRVITHEQLEEAQKIVEAKGFKVVKEKDEDNDIADLAREYNGEEPEAKEDVLFIKTYDYDPDEVADLINAALEDKSVPTYLREIFKGAHWRDGGVKYGAQTGKNYVCIDLGTYEEADEEETIQNLIKLVDAYTENAVGLEAEYGEELLDNYPFLFKKAYISKL